MCSQVLRNQEKEGFSQQGFRRIDKKGKQKPKDVDPAVHLVLTEPQPEGAHFRKTPFQNPLLLVPDLSGTKTLRFIKR